MRTALLALLLAACTAEPEQMTPDAAAPTAVNLIEKCGEVPPDPAQSAAFMGDVVTLTRLSYDDWKAWSAAMRTWTACAIENTAH